MAFSRGCFFAQHAGQETPRRATMSPKSPIFHTKHTISSPSLAVMPGMTVIHRRDFMASAIGGIASTALLGQSTLFAEVAADQNPAQLFHGAGYDPNTL